MTKHEVEALPYDKKALAPYISENTLNFHYDKHHKGYANNLNNLLSDGGELSGKSIIDIMHKTVDKPDKVAIYNNAAQVWNHTFFWNSMTPNGGGMPEGQLAEKINNDFGSFDKFASEFKAAGATVFGSGYAWLVLNNNKLEVVKSFNAGNPITSGKIPLMTIDVWEHAYYLDYQNRRPDFIGVFLEKLVNWRFIENNLIKQVNK